MCIIKIHIIQKNDDCVTRNNFAEKRFIWRIIKKRTTKENFNEIMSRLALYNEQTNQTGITNLLREINKKYCDYNSHKDSYCIGNNVYGICNNTTNIDHKKMENYKKV